MTEDTGNPSRGKRLTVDQLDHISLAVSNIEESRKWYNEILGLESLQNDPDTFVPYLSNGKVRIALLPVTDGTRFSPPVHQGSRLTHAAFSVGKEVYDGYKEHLKEVSIEFEELVHSDSTSIYFSDPDGYVIEITTYEI